KDGKARANYYKAVNDKRGKDLEEGNLMIRKGRKLMKVVAVDEENVMGIVSSVVYRVIISSNAQRMRVNV
ncbi:hypothetical protein A2U01_0094599, partial [Trifolium medium]|nr:hypothetical protein [Trifolium medium]